MKPLRSIMVSLILLVGMALASRPASAQLSEPEKPRLLLGIAFGTSGVETELSLRLTFPRGVQVGKVQAEIILPADKLVFVRAVGRAASGGDVRLDQDGEDVAPGVLEIVAESSARPIPSGVVATLVFRVADEVEPEIVAVGLRGRLWAYPDVSQEITPVETYEGRVNIQEPAVFFACFFYMH